MLTIISDACILIDIEAGGLTENMFQLPYDFAIPDTLFEEELREKHAKLLEFGLVTVSMSGALISDADKLFKENNGPSFNDILALVLAKHDGYRLLTGDKALKKLAHSLNVNVNGTIWLVEEMIRTRIISADAARIAFERMRDSHSRLPWKVIKDMLQSWES